MQLIHSLEVPIQISKPAVLTIGNFDGLHLGHQAVLKKVKEISLSESRPMTVITFENHPYTVLRPDFPIISLCTFQEKIELLKKFGVDILIAIPFTKALSQQSAEEFLHQVYDVLPFSHLILGYDAVLGRGREGNRQRVQAYAKEKHFRVEYLEPYLFEGSIVSSSEIRKCIQEGNISRAELLLGRKILLNN